MGWDWLGRSGEGRRKREDGCGARGSTQVWAACGARGLRGRETAAAWRPGMSRPTLLCPSVAAAAAGVAGTLWSACVSCKAAAARQPSVHRPSFLYRRCQPHGRAGESLDSHPTHQSAGRDHGGREAGVSLAPAVQRRRRGRSAPGRHAQAEGNPRPQPWEPPMLPEPCCLSPSRDRRLEPPARGRWARSPTLFWPSPGAGGGAGAGVVNVMRRAKAVSPTPSQRRGLVLD